MKAETLKLSKNTQLGFRRIDRTGLLSRLLSHLTKHTSPLIHILCEIWTLPIAKVPL